MCVFFITLGINYYPDELYNKLIHNLRATFVHRPTFTFSPPLDWSVSRQSLKARAESIRAACRSLNPASVKKTRNHDVTTVHICKGVRGVVIDHRNVSIAIFGCRAFIRIRLIYIPRIFHWQNVAFGWRVTARKANWIVTRLTPVVVHDLSMAILRNQQTNSVIQKWQLLKDAIRALPWQLKFAMISHMWVQWLRSVTDCIFAGLTIAVIFIFLTLFG